MCFWTCCNEFWWCLNNVAKGMWREEILYVMDTLDFTIRVELKNMLV
ncbi:aminoglycoside 6-adenylyltransferase [Clostridium simiarum]